MLKLNVYCSLLPTPTQVKSWSNYGPWIIRYDRCYPCTSQRITRKALKDEMDGGMSGSPGHSWEPGLEIEVPFEQRPVNEYSSLRDGPLYSWGELSPGSFFLRLGGLCLVTFTVLGVPIAAASFNLVTAVSLFIFAAPVEDFIKNTFATKENASNLVA